MKSEWERMAEKGTATANGMERGMGLKGFVSGNGKNALLSGYSQAL